MIYGKKNNKLFKKVFNCMKIREKIEEEEKISLLND
jgi:hypothetical protein